MRRSVRVVTLACGSCVHECARVDTAHTCRAMFTYARVHAFVPLDPCAPSHAGVRTVAQYSPHALPAHTSASGSTAALWRSASLLKSLGKVRRAIDAYHAMLRHQPTDVRIGKELALLYAPPQHTLLLRTAWSSVRSKLF